MARSDTFTSGPWSGRRCRERPGVAHISGPGWGNFARVVVRMKGSSSDKEEGLSNLALMMAAPTMLEALREAEKALSNGERTSTLLLVQDAISDALTVPELEESSALPIGDDDIIARLTSALIKLLANCTVEEVGRTAYGEALCALGYAAGEE